MKPLLILFALFTVALCNYGSDCKGSSKCGKVNAADCMRAYARYDEETMYSGYTSRVFGDCTAIYRCLKTADYQSYSGKFLQEQFQSIYIDQDCKNCGSHEFQDGQCQATLDYCNTCTDEG